MQRYYLPSGSLTVTVGCRDKNFLFSFKHINIHQILNGVFDTILMIITKDG